MSQFNSSQRTKEPLYCRKGCGYIITFSNSQISSTGKKIPLDASDMQPHSCNGPNSMPPQKQIKKEEPNPKPKPVPIVEGQQTLRSVSEPSGSWQELMIQLLREIRFELQTSREFLEILSRDSTYNKTSEELIAAAKALEESEKAKQKQKQRQNEVPASNVQLHSTRQVPDTSRSTRVRTEEYSTAEEEPSDEDRERYNSYGPDR